ncbi:MAG: PspA/IM30 family protein [Rhizobiales bacterium]|nr:PspA/IM30 family protein [Hyphomicrobiales bacterium]
MGIIDRISQLTRANINDLLDRAEDPEKMLNQILRDMESNIQQARAQVADMIAQEKIIEGDLQQTQKLSSEWNDKARRAVTAGRDDLAREALRRKKDNDDNAAIYQQQADAQKQTVDKLKQQLQALESKYQSTLSNRDALIARQRRAKAQQQVTATLSNFSPLDPSQELNRIEQKIRGNEARAAAMTELQDESFDSQFHELDQDVDIETQLAELKASVGGGSSAPAGAITSGSTSSDSSSSSGGDSGASSGSASGGGASSISEPAPWDTPNNG